MTYRIRITETAKQELRRLPGYVRQRARHIVKVLAEEHSIGRGPEVRGSSPSVAANKKRRLSLFPHRPRGRFSVLRSF